MTAKITIEISDVVWDFLNKKGEPAKVAKNIIESAWERDPSKPDTRLYCVICGKQIPHLRRILISGQRYSYPVCEGKECEDTFTELKTTLLSKHSSNSYNGYCSRCGKFTHIIIALPGSYNVTSKYYCSEHKNPLPQINELPQELKANTAQEVEKQDLDPWQDPDSLFCDGAFLRELMGKEISRCWGRRFANTFPNW